MLTFHRGEWCPYCNLRLRSYQQSLGEFQALGAQLIAVSPQTPDHSLSFAEKNELAFSVLSDEGNETARLRTAVRGRRGHARDLSAGGQRSARVQRRRPPQLGTARPGRLRHSA
ncbi:redoxin domain-containing protein [Streptomyces sp. NPDC055103]